jgi:hypothetical protein
MNYLAGLARARNCFVEVKGEAILAAAATFPSVIYNDQAASGALESNGFCLSETEFLLRDWPNRLRAQLPSAGFPPATTWLSIKLRQSCS